MSPILLKKIMHIGVLPVFMPVITCEWACGCQRGINIPVTWVTNSEEQPCEFCESNLSPLIEQIVFFNTESPIHSFYHVYQTCVQII